MIELCVSNVFEGSTLEATDTILHFEKIWLGKGKIEILPDNALLVDV